MNKVITYLSILALFIAGYCLFAIKGEVQDLSSRLSETSRLISDERNSLNILKAEFAVLQSPTRLRTLADRHLELSSIKSDQITQDPLVASSESIPASAMRPILHNSNTLKHNVSWRYKQFHINRKHLKNVSHKKVK